MQPTSKITTAWQNRTMAESYRTGVSLHSHTSFSRETLTFVKSACSGVPFAGRLIDFYDRRSRSNCGIALDFESAHWRPPLGPLMAYQLERRQIMALGLEAMVSITDHDDLQAPLLLRTIPVARGIPMSVEWTAPFGMTAFHLGIHNLPSATGAAWMERFEAFTATPSDERLHEMLAELHAIAQVLVVFNHPLWDLYKIGDQAHLAEVDRFLTRGNHCIHALELNGLRHQRENDAVKKLAGRWNQVLISGGDRHGLEANANINLTDATSFTEFVHEIRVDRVSHVHFMEQYAEPWERRILNSTVDAISDHAEFSPGWQRWDERAFHRDAAGLMRPLAQLWPDGKAPLPLRFAIGVVRLFRLRSLGPVVSLAFSPGGAEKDAGVARETA